MCFLLFAGSELPQQDMHMTPHTPSKAHTHTHTQRQSHTQTHTQRHAHKESPTHTYIHTHALYALTPKLLQCTTERLAVGQSEVETNKHIYKHTYRESERALPREWASESNDWEREREPVPPNPTFIVRQLLYSAVIVDILCFHLELLWFNVSSQPQKQQKLLNSPQRSAVCTVRKLQRTRSCSLALTNAHCYCPCLCRLFSMRMRDAARCFRSQNWLSCAVAALLPLPFAALYCILHLNLPSVNLTHTEASSCICVDVSVCTV